MPADHQIVLANVSDLTHRSSTIGSRRVLEDPPRTVAVSALSEELFVSLLHHVRVVFGQSNQIEIQRWQIRKSLLGGSSIVTVTRSGELSNRCRRSCGAYKKYKKNQIIFSSDSSSMAVHTGVAMTMLR